VVKHAVVKHPSPVPKAHPILPEARIVPTLVVPLTRTKGSSSALPSIMWVLLEIAAALALITLLQRRRAIPALARLYRGDEADAGGAVAVPQPQSKVARPRAKAKAETDAHVPVTRPQPKAARPRRKAEADTGAQVPVTRPQPKVAPPRRKAEADTDAPVDVTPPVRHVVAVSKVPRPHRKAEADMEAPPVLPTRTRRRLPGAALPKIDRPRPEAEADADPEAAVYARAYLEWLERQ
jgi:hypothetical protein